MSDGVSVEGVNWDPSEDEKRRLFVFMQLANSDIDGCTLAKNMSVMEHWLKTGEIKTAETTPAKTITLRSVPGSSA